MQTLVTVIHVLTCIILVAAVLLQPGKGGGVGAFGQAAGNRLFGAQGTNDLLAQITKFAAGIFIVTSFALSLLSSSSKSVIQNYTPPSTEQIAPTSVPAPTDPTSLPAQK